MQVTGAGEESSGKYGVKKEVVAMRVFLAKLQWASFAYDRFYTIVPSYVVGELEKIELQGNKRRNTLHMKIFLGAG